MPVQIDNVEQKSYVVADIQVSTHRSIDLDTYAHVKLTPRDDSKMIQLTFSKEDWEDFRYQVETEFIKIALGG